MNQVAKDITPLDTLKECFKEVFSTESGKAVLNQILRITHLMNPTFNADGPDRDAILRTAFMEGERNIGMYILYMLNDSIGEHVLELLNNDKEQRVD
jgi:hypothetical protein